MCGSSAQDMRSYRDAVVPPKELRYYRFTSPTGPLGPTRPVHPIGPHDRTTWLKYVLPYKTRYYRNAVIPLKYCDHTDFKISRKAPKNMFSVKKTYRHLFRYYRLAVIPLIHSGHTEFGVSRKSSKTCSLENTYRHVDFGITDLR